MNGSTKKTIGISTAVALCSVSATAAYFKGTAETKIVANTARVADNTAAIREQTKMFADTVQSHEKKCDEAHVRLWHRLGEMQEQQNGTFIDIATKLGRIDGKLGAIEKHIHKGE